VSALSEALAVFAQRVNADGRLKQMNRDWNRTINLVPDDSADSAHLIYQSAEMTVASGLSELADIVLMAPEKILREIFLGQSSPTEPYLAGALRIKGSQEDMMRLDVLSLLIWGN
jgi:putative sterol carrier protein